jgi:predicted ATP-grasp superfamily ATP-dependent carboligase
MSVLVTSSRMPFALAMIRMLARHGERVFAADDYELAPGSHSRYVAGYFVTASPRDDPVGFVADVERIAGGNEIDVVVPAFEECFYLATQHDRLSRVTRLFTPPFATLAPLHDKATFQRMATRLGLRTPETVVARSDDDLRAALERFPRYFARAAFSRGGVSLLTNTGPLAGQMAPDDCHPTPASPWLVQEFVEGETFCTYSTLHGGRVTAHCTYRIPRQWEHSTGIQFVSADSSATLPIVERIAGSVSYDGQVSFDFVDSPEGPMLIECNPRATDGVLLLSAAQLTRGIVDPGADPDPVPPGEEVQLDLAVFAQMFSGGIGEIPRTIQDLVHVRGADRGWLDLLPTLYSFLAFAHHERLRMKERQALFVAMAGDISWDGEPIAGMSEADARVLAELEGPVQ